MLISDSVEGGPSVNIKKARFSNLVLLLFIAIVTVCIVAVGLALLNKSAEKPTYKFLLPKGFTGWVEVTFEQPGFPPLKKEGRTIIYEVPPSGKVMTASKNVSGTLILNYVEQDGRLIELPTDVSMIHGQGTSGGSISGPDGQTEMLPSRLTFFVGTEEQWREAVKNNQSDE
ncbi:hypothetical protein KZ483_02690 [Paenibacillus sp. sptzw28]|uniref:DUF6843 domain-containing protein n=1 Tax=Paenibacillus sp. sptzw28 TaxID=715179 RepID=UPI001C6E0FD9|nr:hypothetical protein [Paenibacillus sp. sptzw28]QYR21962.1 hypothetical protein KZ483_02690 [Paenibacillus sp. sptzw28]